MHNSCLDKSGQFITTFQVLIQVDEFYKNSQKHSKDRNKDFDNH